MVARVLGVMVVSVVTTAATTFTVDPEAGRNTFSAVFDSTVGERITAVSSKVSCTLTVDETSLEGAASCQVPLESIRVDNDDVKSAHFREWATNKKVPAEACQLAVRIPKVKLEPPVAPETAVTFATQGTFSVCGRGRDDEGTEPLDVTITYLPPGTYGDSRVIRIRARLPRFNRERYGVSPAKTDGWLARVQQLSSVVASEGTVEVSLFATAPGAGAQ